MNEIQYGVVLPADYEMRKFREIVRQNGHLLDDRSGLGFKTYLMRERQLDLSPINYYGSFYLWNDAAAWAHFLVGGGAFERIIRGLGRFPVDHWIGVANFLGPMSDLPTRAVRHISPLPQGLDAQNNGLGLSANVEAACERLSNFVKSNEVYTAAIALDPMTWRLITFVAGSIALPRFDETSESYEILHVSLPHRERLRVGRFW